MDIEPICDGNSNDTKNAVVVTVWTSLKRLENNKYILKKKK